MNIYKKEIILDAHVKDVFKFHENPMALERLSPPWQKIKVAKHTNGINKGSLVEMCLYSPLKISWHAKHTEFEKNIFFADIQTKGPFAYWKHNHIFSSAENKTLMTDKIEYRLPFNKLTAPFFKKTVTNQLNPIFLYRHKILKRDLYEDQKFQSKKTILLSGSSGILGQLLMARFLTSGHNVRTLVRHKPKNKNQFYWNPEKQIIDKKAFKNADIVINLSGEPIGKGIWTKKKKKEIIESRINTASLLAKTIDSLQNPPEVFISSSATGFYGNRNNEIIDESSAQGNLFISKVCSKWEKAAQIKTDKTRFIILRTGIVLNPMGGALVPILKTFYWGTAGVLGSGNQYLSWISSEDWIKIVNELIFNENIKGIVNACAPNPVTFKEFIHILSKVVKIPYFFKIPSFLIKMITGQKGYETILCGARVFPKKLTNNNFDFFHPDLNSALKEMLGKEK